MAKRFDSVRPLLSVGQTAKLLGVCRATVLQALRAGEAGPLPGPERDPNRSQGGRRFLTEARRKPSIMGRSTGRTADLEGLAEVVHRIGLTSSKLTPDWSKRRWPPSEPGAPGPLVTCPGTEGKGAANGNGPEESRRRLEDSRGNQASFRKGPRVGGGNAAHVAGGILEHHARLPARRDHHPEQVQGADPGWRCPVRRDASTARSSTPKRQSSSAHPTRRSGRRQPWPPTPCLHRPS